ncbi:MAG TPA: phosphatase PAP2 family protein [Bacteroidia bacterium]|nr:phosphatase PAP2 family protein [Bacteroidia bacterium]
MNNKTFKDLLKDNQAFLLPYLLFLLIGGLLIALYPKPAIHLYINEHSQGLADTFFRCVTWLGDGVTVAIVALFFLFWEVRSGLLLAISGILAGIFTQSLKRTVFSDMERPKKFFEDLHQQLHLVPGVENYGGHTFPSGHTASAFALYFSLAILCKNKPLKMILFFLALLVGFSRVYLSQHFFNDIYAGSLVGIGSALLTWLLLTRASFFRNAGWVGYSILRRKSISL